MTTGPTAAIDTNHASDASRTTRRRGRAHIVLAAVALGVVACGGGGLRPWAPPTERDTKDDPAKVRPGHGDLERRTWWPLTDAENAAMAGLDKAKAGDANALLALAIFASGDKRDAGSYEKIKARVAQFVTETTPKVKAAADEWHRGYEVHRAMHRSLLGGTGKPKGENDLGNYRLDQGRVTTIFETSQYNCISSAMLFTVLARSFDLPVRGVLVPTHAFVELGKKGGKILEVETTNDVGFDLVHDARFYKEAAQKWSASRGLRPVTLEEYQRREILEPYRFMARGMVNEAGREGGAGERDRGRLAEAAARVDPESADAASLRMELYAEEAQRLAKDKAYRTLAKMYAAVGPVCQEALATERKGEVGVRTAEAAAWSLSFFADALSATGRGEDAYALATAAMPRVDPAWKDGKVLASNFFIAVNDRMLELMNAKDYAGALKVADAHLAACLVDRACGPNLEVVLGNWSIDAQNAGDWPTARTALQSCVAKIPASTRCKEMLTDLESRHRF